MPLPSNESHAPSPVIVFDDVHFSYPNHPALNQVSFTVKQGEFVGIIGPNGGGKTTLLKLILGFIKPSSGTIKVSNSRDGSHILSPPRLAYVPQCVRFDRDFPISVEEVVLSGLLSQLTWFGRYRETDKQLAKEILEEMGLAHLAGHAFGTLSGGQAQRALIARALVSKPQILLLDEPTASVDRQAESDIYATLHRLKGKMTILMVTHNLNAAMDHVARILCVQGSVIALKPEEVCKHFAFGLYHMPLISR